MNIIEQCILGLHFALTNAFFLYFNILQNNSIAESKIKIRILTFVCYICMIVVRKRVVYILRDRGQKVFSCALKNKREKMRPMF